MSYTARLLTKALDERDEARAEVERLRDVLRDIADGTWSPELRAIARDALTAASTTIGSDDSGDTE